METTIEYHDTNLNTFARIEDAINHYILKGYIVRSITENGIEMAYWGEITNDLITTLDVDVPDKIVTIFTTPVSR